MDLCRSGVLALLPIVAKPPPRRGGCMQTPSELLPKEFRPQPDSLADPLANSAGAYRRHHRVKGSCLCAAAPAGGTASAAAAAAASNSAGGGVVVEVWLVVLPRRVLLAALDETKSASPASGIDSGVET